MSDCTSDTPDPVSDAAPPPPVLDDGAPVSYAASIKGLFRAKDRTAMLTHFDLWLYEDVKDNAQDIHRVVADGSMPCDNPWTSDKVDLFASWMATGMNP